MYIDTHAHLTDQRFVGRETEIIQNAVANNVKKIITCGTCFKDSAMLLAYLNMSEVYGAVGIHPEEIDTYLSGQIEKLKDLCKNKKIVAIGEVGLDYHYTKDNAELQKDLFIKQILLAEELSLPLIIHSRDSSEDMLQICKTYHSHIKGAVLHCFSGSVEIMKEFSKLGFYFGFGGVSTFSNISTLKEVIKCVPMERILLETDSPYLAPQGFRGKENQPKYIPIIAQSIADIRETNISEIENISTLNAVRLFNLGEC